jgi:Domain of unknown function (DUF4159)
MQRRTAFAVGCIGLISALGILRAQKPFREWPAVEYSPGQIKLPNDYQRPAEWVRARLRYPDVYGYPDHSRLMMQNGPWPGQWTMDYPRSDRHLLEGVRRLTRIDTRSAEQVVSLDGSNEVFNFPALYAVEVGHWSLPDDQAKQLREFLLRGGFLMVDDFHGDEMYPDYVGPAINEWATFVRSITKVFPDRPIEDIPSTDPIFHTLYDLDDRFQVPGSNNWFTNHITYEKGPTGRTPHWRCIRDDKGRIVVAICHNMDLGDGWENSDDPKYEERFSSLAYRVGLDYFIYDLTH